ncbi:hypothetical protein Fot_35653 [Forsythia ovata]|uniref:Uncharacterized protein n=1 Tax=Forsythia ovata TaxID=205694 RepID=A0ABD1SM63_9LAMI
MSGFYFSSMPKFKIRRSGVVDDILLPPLVSIATSVPGVAVPSAPETMRKAAADSKEETSMLEKGMENAGDSQKIERGREDPSSKVEDRLDLTALGKLPAPATIAAVSVHKYWITAFVKATNNAELMELLKLAEMYTSRSHVLNYELYKVLAIKVDELRSMVGWDENVDALCLENKDLQEQLVFSEDARARAIYDITKAKRIQSVCV